MIWIILLQLRDCKWLSMLSLYAASRAITILEIQKIIKKMLGTVIIKFALMKL